MCCVYLLCSCTRIRSGLPGLDQRRSASRWMCSDSPGPASRNPSPCSEVGAGSRWMQMAACSSAGERDRKRGNGIKNVLRVIPTNKPVTVHKRPPSSELSSLMDLPCLQYRQDIQMPQKESLGGPACLDSTLENYIIPHIMYNAHFPFILNFFVSEGNTFVY